MAITVTSSGGNSITTTETGGTTITVNESSTSITVTPPASSSITVTEKGIKGDKGDTGDTGATGATGADGGSDISLDDSPQLGGDLDVQSSKITTSTSNGNVKIDPNGTGCVEIMGDGTDYGTTGAIQLNCSQNTHGVKIQSPAHSTGSTYTLTLPPGVDSSDANKVLQTDASGNLDWVALPSDTNTQNTTTLSFVDSSDDIILRNTTGGAGSGTDDIKFIAGSNITLTHTDADNITIASTDTNTQLSTEQVQDIAGPLVATGGTKTGIAVTYDDANGNMDFVVASDLNTSGNAGTATALATARAINGVDFDGTAAITVPAAGSTLTDTVPVSKGGTNATSFTDKAVIITQDSGTDTLAAAAMTTDGSLLIGGSSGPAVATLTAGSNITITNADGAITIAAAGGGDGGSGDIEGVTAGTGLSGGGSSGCVTLNVEAAQTGITSVVNSSLEIGRDADNRIKFGTDNQIIFRVSGGDGITMKASGEIEATKFDGALEGNADTASALASAVNIGGVSFDGSGNIDLPGVNSAGNQNTSGTAAIATTVTVTDNESTDEENVITFVAGAAGSGNVGLEADGDLTYNPSSGTVSATVFSGNLSGNVDGTESEFVTQTSAVNAAGEAEGTIIKFGNDSTTAGKVYTFSSGTWVEVDANDEAKTKGLLAMALGSNSTTNGMLVHGVGYLNHDPGSAGDILYISHSATGQISSTQPSDSADFVRVVGHCLADNKVFFSPSQDYIDLA